jgi:hypothetical protein
MPIPIPLSFKQLGPESEKIDVLDSQTRPDEMIAKE